LEVDAVRIVNDDPVLYRLTPLGYHLSRLPMDAKVGKVLIVGCMLECLDGALTVAATLSCTKSCFFNGWSSTDSSAAVTARNGLVGSLRHQDR
jgi:HrpA-like RNA helicase